MIRPYLNRLADLWGNETKMVAAGWPVGRYSGLFLQCRLRSWLPRAFPEDRVRIGFGDGRGGGRRLAATLRREPSGGDLTVLTGLVGDQEYRHPALETAGRLLDLGSNIGLAALWFRLVNPRVEIACVEPDPRNVPLLTANVAAAGGPPVRVFPCAVGGRAGTARLGIGADKACSTLLNDQIHRHAESVEVPVRTVPDLLDELGWDRVDVVKMDVEGAEKDVLAGCAGWIGRVGTVLMEIHPVTSPEEVAAQVGPHGFRVRRLGCGFEPTFVLERRPT
jgi:FkbM family methyltransferase